MNEEEVHATREWFWALSHDERQAVCDEACVRCGYTPGRRCHGNAQPDETGCPAFYEVAGERMRRRWSDDG